MDRGTDHQFTYGPRGGIRGIKRKMEPQQGWFVDLESLENLVAFQAKYGDLVFESDERHGSVPTIEIYDGWRE